MSRIEEHNPDNPLVATAAFLVDLPRLKVVEIRCFRPAVIYLSESSRVHIAGDMKKGGGTATVNLDVPLLPEIVTSRGVVREKWQCVASTNDANSVFAVYIPIQK